MAGGFGSDEYQRAAWTSAPVTVSLSGTTARSGALGAGMYYVCADVACYFLQGGSSVDATTASNYLPAGAIVAMRVTSAADGYVAAILASGTGTLFIMQPV